MRGAARQDRAHLPDAAKTPRPNRSAAGISKREALREIDRRTVSRIAMQPARTPLESGISRQFHARTQLAAIPMLRPFA